MWTSLSLLCLTALAPVSRDGAHALLAGGSDENAVAAAAGCSDSEALAAWLAPDPGEYARLEAPLVPGLAGFGSAGASGRGEDGGDLRRALVPFAVFAPSFLATTRFAPLGIIAEPARRTRLPGWLDPHDPLRRLDPFDPFGGDPYLRDELFRVQRARQAGPAGDTRR